MCPCRECVAEAESLRAALREAELDIEHKQAHIEALASDVTLLREAERERDEARQAHEDADAALQSLLAKYDPGRAEALAAALRLCDEVGACRECSRTPITCSRHAGLDLQSIIRRALAVEPRPENCPTCEGDCRGWQEELGYCTAQRVAEPEREGAE